MTLLTGPTLSPLTGPFFQNQDAQLLSHGAVVVGEVLAISFGTVANKTFTTSAATAAGDQANATTAYTARILCVALTAASAAGIVIKVRICGEVDALVNDTSAAGTYMMVDGVNKRLIAATSVAGGGTRIYAIMRETGVLVSNKSVFFNGYGFGQMITNA